MREPSKINIEISGGLGNQLFQFTIGLFLLSRLHDIEINYDKTNYKISHIHEGFLLDRFILQAKKAGYRCDVMQYPSKLIKKLNNKITWLQNGLHEESTPYKFEEELLAKKWDYLRGSWQSYRYLENNPSIEIIKEVLKTKYCDAKFNANAEENCRELIAVHVRRGDYLLSKNTGYGVLPMQYYLEAMTLARSKSKGCKFLIFSDDYAYVEKQFNRKDCITVDDLFGKGSATRDLYLMSICSSMISANSTLSWWGGMLQEQSAIITPAQWFESRSEYDMMDFIPPNWIRIVI